MLQAPAGALSNIRHTPAQKVQRLYNFSSTLPRPKTSTIRCNSSASSAAVHGLVRRVCTATLATLVATLSGPSSTPAVDYAIQHESTVSTPSQVHPAPKLFQLDALTQQDAPDIHASSQLSDGRLRYSEFIEAVESGKVERVRFSRDGSHLHLMAKDGSRASVVLPGDPGLMDSLARHWVEVSVAEGEQEGDYIALLGNIVFPLAAFAGLFFLFRRAQGGQAGGQMEFGRSKSKFQEVPETGVTFDDVAGCDGAKLELQEVVDFLKNPDKYTALGAKIPKGCLLVGPPGTGKTLIAKAVAGEAGVPFFSCAASEFVELFVGVGASRVRDLFEKAKSKAPCIVFIDEIDAVGRQRGAGLGGGNDEREQTINQLLTEMDGFEGNTGVIVLAATNRPDVLDKALLRPGRFDRQVTVDRPDFAGRVAILRVHAKGKALSRDVDLDSVARRTPGFTGADLQNLLNEAAILAARRGLTEISRNEVSDALERLIAGPEKVGGVLSERRRRLVAYHEAGHAVVGCLLPEHDAVSKVSIVPRGAAGGLTFFAPSEDRLESGLYSRTYLENQMAVALGGRIAEELIVGEQGITTGASGDFQQVTRIARMMVTQLGFGRGLGQVAWSSSSGSMFLGNSVAQPSDFSMDTADKIDSEVKRLVETAYRRAKDLLLTNIDLLHKVAGALMERENLDGDELMQMVRDSGAEQYLKKDAPGTTIPYQQGSTQQ